MPDDGAQITVHEIGPFQYRWPEEVGDFSRGWEGTIVSDGRTFRIRHGLGRRVVYGRDRIYAVTWVNDRPTIQGVEADDYSTSRALLTLIKRGRNFHVSRAEDVSADFDNYEVVIHREQIRAPHSPSSLAFKIKEDDLHRWFTYALDRFLERSSGDLPRVAGLPSASAPQPVPPEQTRHTFVPASNRTEQESMANLPSYFTFFAQMGKLFEARFLRPLWSQYPSRESDDWQALSLFLEGYAFERQGRRPDFSHVAVDAVEELRRRGQCLVHNNTAQLAWDIFRDRLDNQGLNHANNPLCPQRTEHERRRKGEARQATTYNKSVVEFLCDLSKQGLPSNIVVFVRERLELDQAKAAHDALQRVNGIGPKIASFFLRDVALFYNLTPLQDRHLLQPIDTWIRRMSEQFTQQRNVSAQDREKVQDKEIQKWVLQESMRCGVRPEAVNEGTWYFSSQVVGSEYRMGKALNDLSYAKTLLVEHIEAVRQEVEAYDNLQGC